MKEISSIPGAVIFRSYSSIIIVLICIVSFLSFTDHLSDKAERIARDRVVTDIQYSLAMMLYDYTIKGKQDELKKFDRENPFIPVAIYRSLPLNYRGVIAEMTTDPAEGWYFEKNNNIVIYVTLKDERQEYVMRYRQGKQMKTGSLHLESKRYKITKADRGQ